jgi:hypothetical protein
MGDVRRCAGADDGATMGLLAADEVRIVKARDNYVCRAEPCLLPTASISRGELHVSSPNESVTRDSLGRLRTDLQRIRFARRYHLLCFRESRPADDDSRRAWSTGELEQLAGFERNEAEVRVILARQEGQRRLERV